MGFHTVIHFIIFQDFCWGKMIRKYLIAVHCTCKREIIFLKMNSWCMMAIDRFDVMENSVAFIRTLEKNEENELLNLM